ncbi:hypothetical protein KIW84_015928 [Lathyrus oleraceus]|uniref:Uncharacterized protein n=1 Tax=Pisum sativum TaxID=3888 RepID=A0A9D5BS35_PEA|nr:hypothetical protein KIW84_015928 [Pisum sativum]
MGRGRGRPKKNKVLSPSILTTLLQQSVRNLDSEGGSHVGMKSNSVISCDEKKETIDFKSPESNAMKNDLEKETLEEQSPKLWIDIISGNRMPSNGATIEFVAPNLIEGEIEV